MHVLSPSPREGLGGRHGDEGVENFKVGCMTEATTTLTRAASNQRYGRNER